MSLTALGTGAIVLPSGWSLTRSSSNDTVQTSATTVASGLAANAARGGNDGTHAGLVIEETRTNLVTNSRDMNASGWVNSGETRTSNYANGPDGTLHATRDQISIFSSYFDTSGNGTFTASFWGRGTSASQTLNPGWVTNTAGSFPLTTSWARGSGSAATGGVATIFDIPQNSSSGSKDVLLDLFQLEAGAFATEAIPTSGGTATRSGDFLSSTGKWVDSTGRVSAWFTLQPKGSSSQYSQYMQLFWIDANNWCKVSNSTGAIICSVGGVTYTTPVAMSWAAGDTVDIYVAFGGGALASKVEYRVNGGAATVLSTGSPPTQAAMTAPSSISVFTDGTANQFSAWIPTTPTTYTAGHGPIWLV